MPTKSQQTKILWQSHTLQVLAEVATKLQDLKACWQSLASLGSGQSNHPKSSSDSLAKQSRPGSGWTRYQMSSFEACKGKWLAPAACWFWEQESRFEGIGVDIANTHQDGFEALLSLPMQRLQGQCRIHEERDTMHAHLLTRKCTAMLPSVQESLAAARSCEAWTLTQHGARRALRLLLKEVVPIESSELHARGHGAGSATSALMLSQAALGSSVTNMEPQEQGVEIVFPRANCYSCGFQGSFEGWNERSWKHDPKN